VINRAQQQCTFSLFSSARPVLRYHWARTTVLLRLLGADVLAMPAALASEYRRRRQATVVPERRQDDRIPAYFRQACTAVRAVVPFWYLGVLALMVTRRCRHPSSRTCRYRVDVSCDIM
ncbi:unnamed protein product, partial [Ectocarpus fasciculatus]